MIEEQKQRILQQIEENALGNNIIVPVEIQLPSMSTMEDKMSYVRTILSDLQIEHRYNVLSTQYVDNYCIVEVKKGDAD